MLSQCLKLNVFLSHRKVRLESFFKFVLQSFISVLMLLGGVFGCLQKTAWKYDTFVVFCLQIRV